MSQPLESSQHDAIQSKKGPAPSNSSSSRSENAVNEGHRRFPTSCAGSRFSRGFRSIRPAPYPSRRPAGRPRESLTVSKNVIVIEYEHDRVPSKAEKIKLEKSGIAHVSNRVRRALPSSVP